MNGMQVAPYQDFAKEKLGFEFTNIQLLITALTHRSYVNEHRKSVSKHNERLEFLGDAVLELVVTDFLFRNYSEQEGILTNWRAALVRTESIGAAGTELNYEPLLRMSHGERHGSDRARQQIIANAFEAVTGAIYLERGYDDASAFIYKHIISRFDDILKSGSWRDAKSHLQEVSQRVDNRTPQYQVLEEVGPDHDKTFTLGVYVGDKLMGTGVGPNKQIAQQQAAQAALGEYERQEKTKEEKISK
jgi:ribonuclease-3